MELVRIIIALAKEAQSIKMKNLLIENGYDVIWCAKDGLECLRKARTHKPDLVILDYDLPSYTGHEVAKILSEDDICNTILLVNDAQKSMINEYSDKWDFICLSKPITISGLISTIELTVKNRKRIKRLEKEIEDLKDSIESRKLVEQAKGILMEKFNLTENEAFRKIQKQSMDKRLPIKDVAKEIMLDERLNK